MRPEPRNCCQCCMEAGCFDGRITLETAHAHLAGAAQSKFLRTIRYVVPQRQSPIANFYDSSVQAKPKIFEDQRIRHWPWNSVQRHIRSRTAKVPPQWIQP